MEDILSEFMSISEEPYVWLSKWKEVNKKGIMLCYPMHLPEEIVHAAGLLPAIIQRSHERILLSHNCFQAFYCDFSRSTLDLILRDVTDFADGVVLPDTCYVNRGLAHMIQVEKPDVLQFDVHMVPMLEAKRPIYRDWVFQELERFKAKLEAFVGHEITDESLRNSIQVYNENRALLRRLYDLRISKPGLINSKEVLSIVVASMLMPKEEHNGLMKKLLPELEKREPVAGNGVNILLSGAMCEAVSVDLLDFMESLGVVVVDDDLYVGSRYFAVDCDETLPPLESLVGRYFNRNIPDPTKYNPDKEYSDYLIDRVRKANARGVIIVLVLHCEPHWYAHPKLKDKLDPAGIPHFHIETEQESLSLARIRTRLEAFLEMVKGGR
ncbi:MAG: 2-hydroxyacyl-CoA dehydratase family protein [Chloroflexota bacterium]|nr:2-hydroxyacyl-CoA dehydratase family protein [Chloroflexota bacterium]